MSLLRHATPARRVIFLRATVSLFRDSSSVECFTITLQKITGTITQKSKVFSTSTLGCSWNEFGDLSLYEAKSSSLIP
jgi:hypothetical protein